MLKVCTIPLSLCYTSLLVQFLYVENFILAYLLRAKDQVVGIRKMFTEPSSKLLLPDPLPFPYRKPYTLVIELKDLLLHSEYDVSWTRL